MSENMYIGVFRAMTTCYLFPTLEHEFQRPETLLSYELSNETENLQMLCPLNVPGL